MLGLRPGSLLLSRSGLQGRGARVPLEHWGVTMGYSEAGTGSPPSWSPTLT